MRAGQRLLAQDGYEVCLFPCEAMYVTNREHGVLALDFGPRDTAGQRISPMNCYAPFSGTVVYTGNDHNLILESDNLVHMPDGSLQYGRVLVAHSWIAPTLGQHFTQGQLFYKTGNYGQSTAEHLHMEIARVPKKATRKWNESGIGLYNAIHMWNGMYVNDTTILYGGGFNWHTYQGGVTPSPAGYGRKTDFPWVLYYNRLRRKRR